MRIHTLSTEECVLPAGPFARPAGLLVPNQPYIVPIYFSFGPDRRRVYTFSSVGQKIEWMRQNPAVCLAIDDIRDKDHWTTVLVFGRYRELRRGQEHAEERRVACELLRKRPQWWLPAAGKVADYEHPDVVLYSVDADRFTGRPVEPGRLEPAAPRRRVRRLGRMQTAVVAAFVRVAVDSRDLVDPNRPADAGQWNGTRCSAIVIAPSAP